MSEPRNFDHVSPFALPGFSFALRSKSPLVDNPRQSCVVGFLAAFMTDAPIASVFGSARWAMGKELQNLSTTDEGLLIGRDPTTDKLLRYDGPSHLLTGADENRQGRGHHHSQSADSRSIGDLHRSEVRKCQSRWSRP
ncbi:hypothetical protein ASD03_31325 [Ensifer sp. Root127]|nr:hypothetical protein ASD03_31325 [Ensifer sp. Root127]